MWAARSKAKEDDLPELFGTHISVSPAPGTRCEATRYKFAVLVFGFVLAPFLSTSLVLLSRLCMLCNCTLEVFTFCISFTDTHN